MDLLPGLPFDVAMECLIRLPLHRLSSATSVSKNWKAQIEFPDFLSFRKSSRTFQSIFVFAQLWVDPTRMLSPKIAGPLFYRLVAFDPENRKWSDLPPVPDFPNGLPILCHLAAVGSELVVIGGCDPMDWRIFDSVFIYNFLNDKWRRGAHMPGGQRFLFGCASDSNRVVYVAGGHDEDKRALKSVLKYDVAENKWTELPDMARERDECKAIFHHGKFHVIGGYSTEGQGRFTKDAEVFNTSTWRWGPVEDEFIEDATCPRTCIACEDGCMYKCCKGHVMVRKGATWRVLIGLPDEMCHVDYVTAWREKLLVIGYSAFGGAHKTYLLDVKDCTWEQVEASVEYSGHVQSGCYLDI